MKTLFNWLFQATIVTALGYGTYLYVNQPKEDPIEKAATDGIEEATLNLPVVILHPATVTPTYISLAKVEEWRSTTLSSEATGRIVWVCGCYEKGQPVQAGVPLLRIDQTSYLRDIVEQEKDLSNARAALVTAQSETEQARENYARLDLGAPSDAVLKIPELTAAQLAVTSSEAALDIARKSLAETEIKAPFDGILSAADTQLGDLVGNGANLGGLVGTETFLVRFPILESQLSLVQIGEEIAITSTTMPVITKRGIVRAIDIDIDQTTRLNTVIVAVEAPVEGEVLRLGRFVNGAFTGAPLNNLFAVPLVALDNDGQYYEVGPDNRLIAVLAQPVYRDFNAVYIDAGQRARLEIVTGNVLGLRAGMLVSGYAP